MSTDQRNDIIIAAKTEFDGAGTFLQALTSRFAFVAEALRAKGLPPLSEQEKQALEHVTMVCK
ncbi:MAG: hypothetical protein Q7R41_15780 [Phycisphaerales bacterium]|nr:hypothetical protein [Phycisphaerales bacterium]